MCGIAGIVAWDDRYRATRDTLEKMSARIAHRGPDGEGIWINHEDQVKPERPQAGFAHRRLAIIDPDPRANQPFHLYDAHGRPRLTLVFNGEIYNFRELRAELSRLRPDYAWRTDCDTEALLVAYDFWREKCVEHFNGMFAFAIWDEQEKSLFLARDRMGQKPLYFALITNGRPALSAEMGSHQPCGAIAFASELSPLRQLQWIDTSLCSNGFCAYLSMGYIPNGSIYRGVIKLDPSYRMNVTASGHSRKQYFQSNLPHGASSVGSTDARARTRQLLHDAVRRQLVSDVPLGCFLSGGMDSSVITSAMKSLVPPDQPILTFSIGFHDSRYDESSYAAAVATHLGTKHHQFSVTPDAAGDLPKLAEVFGEPFADSSALPTHYLARETRRYVKVALSGDGGDELFGGYDRYRAMAMTSRFSVFPSPLIRALGRVAGWVLPGTHARSYPARMKRLAAAAHLPAGQRYASYVRLLNPDLIHELLRDGPAPCEDNLPALFDEGLKARPVVPNSLAVDRVTYLPEDLLTKVDRASMLHALEVRSPFMDHELVHFAAGLTTDQLLRGGPKRMLREAFADDLPAWVFKRRKMGFAVPIGEWFRTDPNLRAMLHDNLFAADSFARGHFNLPVVQRLIDEHEAQRIDHSQRLYALLMLELWWRLQR